MTKIIKILMISFFGVCLLGLSISFIRNPYWLSIDTCVDNGQVWDYQNNICRDDCLIWKKEFGCIKLTPEQTKLLKQCKNLSNCPNNQTFKEIQKLGILIIMIVNLTLYPKIVLNYQEIGNIQQFAIKGKSLF